jgi:methylmalonyl-CoA epimerase
MFSKIDHIGIAVRNLEESSFLYENVFHLSAGKATDVPSQGVRVRKFSVGETHLELLEPTTPHSPVAAFLEKRGEGIHHICYAVPHLDAALEEIRRGGLVVLGNPAPGADGRRVVFIHPKSTFGVLIELVEDNESSASK